MSTPSVTCSDGSAVAGEPLAGSAPYAPAWVALEQSGPWGPRALTDSHLEPDLGRAIESAAAEHDIRPSLIRCPGRHADSHAREPGDPRTVLVAWTHPSGPWLLKGTISAPDRLLDLDWAALAGGDRHAVHRSLPSLAVTEEPQLLVCTNGRRDLCCASKGRPVALGVARGFPGQVWEVTHTSGHRFAPTSVLLPAGTLHGRLDVTSAGEVLRAAAAGETVLAGSRGRSTWSGPAQAAELAVRERLEERGLNAVTVTSHHEVAPRVWVSEVAHADGRSWRVHTESHESPTSRAESCGKALKPMTYLTAVVEA